MPIFNATSTGPSGTTQSWTVDVSGVYRIVAHGAQGGGTGGGRGAHMVSDFDLVQGEVLTILVGQAGAGNAFSASGGGASYVRKGTTLLIVAGGGGGATNGITSASTCDASTGTSGKSGYGAAAWGSGAGGTGGNGGAGTGGTGGAGGGGGWASDGAGTDTRNGKGYPNGYTGGPASGGGNPMQGGYGGGGASQDNGGNFRGAGGGGGYSGGGGNSGSSTGDASFGGGGGSYTVGTSVSAAVSSRTGAGLVEITLTNNPPTAPGAFTDPIAGEVHDTSVAYSHGASTDPDGNFSHYYREYTTNGGTNWNGAGTSTLTSDTLDSTGWPETTNAAIRVRGNDTEGAISDWTVSPFFTIDHNDPPMAPILLSPEEDAAVNLTSGVTFSWTHNDFEGDAQTGWAIKRLHVTAETASSPEWWNEEWWDEAAAAWVNLNTPGAPMQVVNTGTITSKTISVWPDAKSSYLYTIATQDAGSGKLGEWSAWRALNPYKWWIQPHTSGYQIDTSSEPTATAYFNQKKLDRCQNGVLWSLWWDGSTNTTSSYRTYYSTDEGVTWNAGTHFGFSGAVADYPTSASLFIDVDDYAHVVYRERNHTGSNGDLFYRRGTPNVTRTAWTWSAETRVMARVGSPGTDFPDIVVHREGTGWAAHIVAGIHAGTTCKARYNRVTIASNGALTVGAETDISPDYGTGAQSWPSIDFHHTGDGKTVAGGTPHLYVAWVAGATGAGLGIRFKKATYSAGSWTWNPEREIDSTRSVTGRQFFRCVFDGTRIVIAGVVSGLFIHDRDVADTTTIQRAPLDGIMGTISPSSGSLTYDSQGNIYYGGSYFENGYKIAYWRWTRADGSVGYTNLISDQVGSFDTYMYMETSTELDKIYFVYTNGSASPYAIIGGLTPAPGKWSNAEHWNTSSAEDATIPATELETGVEYSWTVATGD